MERKLLQKKKTKQYVTYTFSIKEDGKKERIIKIRMTRENYDKLHPCKKKPRKTKYNMKWRRRDLYRYLQNED